MRTVLISLAVLSLAACGGSDYRPPPGGAPAAGASAGKDWSAPSRQLTDQEADQLLVTRCTRCHTLDRIRKTGRPLEQWCADVQRMMDKPDGALIGDSDASALVHYLTKKYGQ